jgi:hypothetical protein
MRKIILTTAILTTAGLGLGGTAAVTAASAATTPGTGARVLAFAESHFSGGSSNPDWLFFTTRSGQTALDTMRFDTPYQGRPPSGWTAWTASRAYDPHAFREIHNQVKETEGSVTLTVVRRIPGHSTRYFSKMTFRSGSKVTVFNYTSGNGWRQAG